MPDYSKYEILHHRPELDSNDVKRKEIPLFSEQLDLTNPTEIEHRLERDNAILKAQEEVIADLAKLDQDIIYEIGEITRILRDKIGWIDDTSFDDFVKDKEKDWHIYEYAYCIALIEHEFDYKGTYANKILPKTISLLEEIKGDTQRSIDILHQAKYQHN